MATKLPWEMWLTCFDVGGKSGEEEGKDEEGGRGSSGKELVEEAEGDDRSRSG